VAIRTLTLSAAGDAGAATLAGPLHRGRMGVGAGIVIDSRAADEYDECRLKARFLTALDPGFALFETLFATREAGVRNLPRHLARLAASAAALDFVHPCAEIEAALARQLGALPPATPYRLRLALHKDGRIELVAAALDALPPGAATVRLAERPLDDPQGLGAHKTTLRARYDEGLRAALAAGAFDTLFFDSAGRLTEGARSNVFLLLDGEWRTPPAGRGVLPGTMRAALLEDPSWAAREAELTRGGPAARAAHRADERAARGGGGEAGARRRRSLSRRRVLGSDPGWLASVRPASAGGSREWFDRLEARG
jgi:para-aminobenzoate synthetase/4-amino-4-deoxychorismate lyase